MKTLTENTIDCCICGEIINLVGETPDYFMGEPAHLNCASDMRDQVRTVNLTPKDIDDIIA